MSTPQPPPESGSRVALYLRIRRRIVRRPRRRPPAAPEARPPLAGTPGGAGAPGTRNPPWSAAAAPPLPRPGTGARPGPAGAGTPRGTPAPPPPPAGPLALLRAALAALAVEVRRRIPGPWLRTGALLAGLAAAFLAGRGCTGPDLPPPGDETARRPPPAETRPVPLPAPAPKAPQELPEPPEPDERSELPEPPAPDLRPQRGENQVLCISKPGRSPRKSIQQIGGERSDGTPWRIDRDEAIAGIKAHTWSFHVGSGDAAAEVIVDVTRAGNEVLKTRPDGREDNNLLSLPECP